MTGHDFEKYCARLLSLNGFTSISVTRDSGDQGIDIIAYKGNVKYGIQCKLYSSRVGNSAVQEAYSGKDFYKCQIGAVLTNNDFTDSAKELADSLGVLLWDGNFLNQLQQHV
jgi:restriction system protein